METAISLDKKERGTGHPNRQQDSPRHGPLTTDPLVALKEENILTSASGVQKPERFDLYVGKLRSICEMHGVPTGSHDHLSGFLNRLDDDRRFGMDFWAFVGRLSSREGGELNDDQTLAVVVAGITGQLPDENDDRLRPQINHLRALLSGVDIQRPESQLPESQLPEPPAPARPTTAVPIDHRRRRFSITPEDAPPTLETQMLETIQRLELINRQLKESLVSIDQRINLLETRFGEHPTNARFSEEPAPPVSKIPSPVAPPPVVTRRVVNPPVEALPVAPPPIDEVHLPPVTHRPRVEQATPSLRESFKESIEEPAREMVRQPIEQPLRRERYSAEPALPPAEHAAQTAPPIEEQSLPPAVQAAPSIEEPIFHAAEPPAAVEERLIPRPASVDAPETHAILTTPDQETPAQKSQVRDKKIETPPIPRTQVPETQISKTQAPATPAPKTQAKPLGTTSKQRLVLDPIAPPAPSSESSSDRTISKTHTRPLFAGYESSSGSPGKKVAAGLAIAFLLAGSGYAWHRYSTLITQLVHPNQTASSTTRGSDQPTDATPEDSTSQPAQPPADQQQIAQPQTAQPQPSQTQTDQPAVDQSSTTTASTQPETTAPQPRKPAVDRPPAKAAAAADDLFSNSNWSAIKVPSEVMQKNLIVSRVPTYPDAAKASRVKGSVVVEALIQKDGSVGRVRVLQGDSRLRNAAMDAIFRQKYRPYVLNGTAVDVITTVSLDFTPPE